MFTRNICNLHPVNRIPNFLREIFVRALVCTFSIPTKQRVSVSELWNEIGKAIHALCNSMSIRLSISNSRAVRSRLLSLLSLRSHVCLNVEVDEKEEIAGQETAAKERSTLCSCARAHRREFARPVSHDEV